MDKKQRKLFLNAVNEMGTEKGISSDIVLNAIEESFQIAFTKKLEEEYNVFKTKTKQNSANKVKLNDALVRCAVDLKNGNIDVFQRFLIVEDEDIQDDFIEKGISEIKELNSKLKVGDYYEIPIDFDKFGKADVNRFVSAFKQKITRAEKENLLKLFSGRIGEIVTGNVEKADHTSVIVSLGRTSVTLLPRDLIGHETFKVGDSIKVFVEGIGKDDKKGSLIKCSRSCPGFIRKLFENEVHEIYDQTVLIKDVARISGVRSKISVYSNDPYVDASGACIGQNGSRIQAIVAQLGNSKESKEKLDVITYHENLGLYLEECLKPGVMLGAKINEEEQSAIVIMQNDTGSLAIGAKGQNVILARQLTHLKNITIIEESEALEKNIDFTTLEEFQIEAREEEKRKTREAAIKNLQNAEESTKDVTLDDVTENFIDKDEYDDDEIFETVDTPVVEENVEETVNETVEIPVEEPVSNEEKTEEIVEEKVEEVKKKAAPVYEQAEVTTTTTIDALEKSLEEEKKIEQSHGEHHSRKKKEAKDTSLEDEIAATKKKDNTTKMSIYTDEELEEFDEEYDENFEDEDYSEYDSDEYYDN